MVEHLIDEEPAVGQLRENPDPYAQAVVVHTPRRRDGKDLTYIDAHVIEVVSAIRYVEQKAFVAQDSMEYPIPLIILDHELERTSPLSELQDVDTAAVEVKMNPTAWSEPVEVTAGELNSARGSRK